MRYVFCLLFLSLNVACSSQDEGYSDLEFASADVAEACDFTGVPEDSYAFELQKTQCERAQLLEAHSQSQQLYRQQSEALFSGRCDLFFELWGAPLTDIEENWPSLAGGMHWRGLCTPRSPEKAFAVLNASVERGLDDPSSLAQLGALYWAGEGVPQDQQRARQLFRLAALYAFPEYYIEQSQFMIRAGRWSQPLLRDDANSFWGVTKVQTWLGFMPPLLGPWDLPELLRQERLWMEGVYMSGPVGIVEIAEQLWRGLGEYPQLPNLAVRWLVAADLSGAPNADYMLAKLHLDIASGRLLVGTSDYERIARPERSIEQNLKCYGYLEMGSAVLNDHQPALLWFLEEIIKEIRANPLIDFQAFSAEQQSDVYALVAHVGDAKKREDLAELISGHDSLVYQLYASGAEIPTHSKPALTRIFQDLPNTFGVFETFLGSAALQEKFCAEGS